MFKQNLIPPSQHSSLNKKAIEERRNPLTAMQIAAAKRLAKLQIPTEQKRPTQVYALSKQGPCGTVQHFYVGISVDPQKRWEAHRSAINLQVDMKPAYEEARFLGIENIFMTILDEAGEFTEDEWINILTEQGHQLTNVATGQNVMRKDRKKPYEHQLAVMGIGDFSNKITNGEVWQQMMDNAKKRSENWYNEYKKEENGTIKANTRKK